MRDAPKPLRLSLRKRKRYIVFQVISEEKIILSDLTNAIWHSLLGLLGELSTAQSNVWIMKNNYDEEKQIGLIRCSHKLLEHVRSALALVQRIGDKRVIIRILGVSGTIKGAKRKFLSKPTLLSFTKQ